MSSSSSAIPNFARSGLKLTQVQFSLALQAVILGLLLVAMLSVKRWWYLQQMKVRDSSRTEHEDGHQLGAV